MFDLKTINNKNENHRVLVKHQVAIPSKDGVSRQLDKVVIKKVEPIVKKLRETLELFKKGEPEGIGNREFLRKEIDTLNELETLCGLAPSFWSKDDDGQWTLLPKNEV